MSYLSPRAHLALIPGRLTASGMGVRFITGILLALSAAVPATAAGTGREYATAHYQGLAAWIDIYDRGPWERPERTSLARTPHVRGARRAYRHTRRAIRLIRAKTGDPSVPVHVIGGIAKLASVEEVRGFARAALRFGAAGASLYDAPITSAVQWAQLRRLGARQRARRARAGSARFIKYCLGIVLAHRRGRGNALLPVLRHCAPHDSDGRTPIPGSRLAHSVDGRCARNRGKGTDEGKARNCGDRSGPGGDGAGAGERERGGEDLPRLARRGHGGQPARPAGSELHPHRHPGEGHDQGGATRDPPREVCGLSAMCRARTRVASM